MIIYITPCLFGFDVKTQAGPSGFIRHAGFWTASELMDALKKTEEIKKVVLL